MEQVPGGQQFATGKMEPNNHATPEEYRVNANVPYGDVLEGPYRL